MELFFSATNSPQQIFDIFGDEGKGYQCQYQYQNQTQNENQNENENENDKEKSIAEDGIDNKINGASFFEDPKESTNFNDTFRQENFVIDMPLKNQTDKDNKDFCVFDAEKSEPKPAKKRDPKKNICGYITKRAIRELLSDKYKGFVWKLCVQYKCKKMNLKKYLLSKIQSMIGPLHLQNLLNPSEDAVEMSCKKVFFHFFEWFIKERYIRYLTIDGKMDDKLLYVQYKNKTLARVIRTVKGRYEQLQK